MNTYALHFGPAALTLCPSGAMWWAEMGLLVVSDLHLGKSERMARRGGALLPPYETEETLARLRDDIAETEPKTVICLGDSFDDCRAADALAPDHTKTLAALMAGRDWVWIEGNHDPGPLDVGGRHAARVSFGDLVFRHIAGGPEPFEVSGHYHPKASVRGRGGRACFLTDGARLILPAYGAYTGGMAASEVARLAGLRQGTRAILTGRTMVPLPIACDA